MPTPIYKKVKPFLARRFAASPPKAAGGLTLGDLLPLWTARQLSSSFNARRSYTMPGRRIDKKALAYFNKVERDLARLAAAGKILDGSTVSGVAINPFGRLQFIVPPLPMPDPPMPPGGGWRLPPR